MLERADNGNGILLTRCRAAPLLFNSRSFVLGFISDWVDGDRCIELQI